MKKNSNFHPSSFRDPDAFIFENEGKLYRQINKSYKNDYDLLASSGLYKKLLKGGVILKHEEVDDELSLLPDRSYKTLLPDNIPFISYPYEWCFEQLKDAALLTLKIQKESMDKGMILKDASAYNIQFHNGKAMLIDIGSFSKYEDGAPWVAYKQFCQHFLAPLTLMLYCDVRSNSLLRNYIDGIPLDLAKSYLPTRAKFNFGILVHVILHSKSINSYANSGSKIERRVSKTSIYALIDSLRRTIEKLSLSGAKTEWGEYYSFTNYSDESSVNKRDIISKMIDEVKPNSVWDIGANNGFYSRIASDKDINTISFDYDHNAVSKSYYKSKEDNEGNILPLIMDFTNPSSNIGWGQEERFGLKERGKADLCMSLAFIHHIAISNNIPLHKIASFFADISNNLIIEFIPKEDSQVQKLLTNRKDIFDDYNKDSFEKAFSEFFKILRIAPVKDSVRSLYLMKRF